MKLIRTESGFRRLYPYKTPSEDKFPKQYPCFCEVVWEDGGLGGDYKWVRIVYPPAGVDLRSFGLGLRAMEKALNGA